MSEDPTRPLPNDWQQPSWQPNPPPQQQQPSWQPNPPQPSWHPNPPEQQQQSRQPAQPPPPPPPQQQQQQSWQPTPPPPPQQQQSWQPSAATQVYSAQAQAPRARRRKWPLRTGIALVVLLILLIGGDRVANAVAENAMATQFQTSVGLSHKPNVSIKGFPFLTQLIAGDFHEVDISATNESTGQVQIASLNAVLTGMHPHGTTSATIDKLTATGLITFAQLANVGGIPGDVTLTPGGGNTIKATASLGPLSDTATAQVTRKSANDIHIHLVDAGGIPLDLLGNLTDFDVTLPKLPAGVSITGFNIDQQGLHVSIAGQNVSLSQ